MSRPVSRARVIRTIVGKDLAEYARDRLWAFLTILVLVFVVAIFWVLPDEVDESIRVGVTGIDQTALLSGFGVTGDEGLVAVPIDSAAELQSVIKGDQGVYLLTDGSFALVPVESDPPADADPLSVPVGIAFPEDFFSDAPGDVIVYADASLPEEVEAAVSGMVRELAFAVGGVGLPVDVDPARSFVVLGEDRSGDQVTVRDGFRPVFVFLILLMELFVMASLIAKEIQDRTVSAILVTPATIGDVLASKGIAGALSGFAQAVIVLLAIGALATQPVLMLTLMLLGSVMVSGTAMLVGSTGRDFISTLFYGMAFMVPLLIPAFAALFPGTASIWVRALPSYPLVEALTSVSTYGAGWADTVPQLLQLAAWCVALFGLGWFVLRRKVQSL